MACATTRPRECSYHANAPASRDGQLAWEAFLDDAWRIRVAGMSYIAGIDADRAIARLIASDVPREFAEELIAACEQGFVSAMNQKDDDDASTD